MMFTFSVSGIPNFFPSSLFTALSLYISEKDARICYRPQTGAQGTSIWLFEGTRRVSRGSNT